jgi:hypothetical protein
MILEPINHYFALALELGKINEGTAFAVVERVEPPAPLGPIDVPPVKHHFEVRGKSRFAAGTGYGEITDGVMELLASAPVAEELHRTHLKTSDGAVRSVHTQWRWVVDQTAVGAPIVDMVLEKLEHPCAHRVIFAGHHTETEADGLHYIPKHLVISEIEALMDQGRLKISDKHPLTPYLRDALLNYKEKRSAPIASAIDPWREHAGDDLVFAVGLACRRLRTVQPLYEFL